MPVNAPFEVADPIATIAAAENEASSLDILVCGNCQSVFHFVEEFQEHKSKNDCEKADKSSLNSQGNKKPQVWAFLIWKNSQTKAADQQGSWKLYQKWCNMPETQRQSWVTAGRNIQAFINLSHARELNKVDANNKENDREVDEELEEDFIVEKIVGKRYNHKKKRVEYLLKWEGYPPEQNTWEPLSNLTTCKSLLQEYERLAAQQLNDKSPASRLSGVLKKDVTTSQIKLPVTPNNKPIGILPKFADKKNDTPTLQTQRKIVPATPLSNSMANTKPVPTFERYTATMTKPEFKNADEADNIADSRTPLKKKPDDVASPVLSLNDKVVKPKFNEQKDWNASIDDNDLDTSSLKRTADGDESSDDAKRVKLSETTEEPTKNETLTMPRSGIFKKSEVRDQFPSITTMLGKDNPKDEASKSLVDQKGILKIDHSHMPELQSGIYKMSVKGGIVKIDSVTIDKNISGTLPTMPGPKGGVLILGNRFDLSKISKASPKTINSPVKSGVLQIDQSPALRGIFQKNDAIKQTKPDFQKSFATVDSKKPVNSLRKVFGGPLPRGRGRTTLGYGEGVLDTSTRLVDADGFLLEFCEYENSDMEDYSLPDDFPEELDMEPLSPARPLTLDPETGKRLMRAEGEPTPEPTPEPSPEPSPVPSPVPQMICKEEKDVSAEGLILKAGDDGDGETYTEINGNRYKVTSGGQVGLLQNAAFATQGETELKAITVTGELGDEEHAENTNMITITGEDGLVYQVANAKLEGDTIVVASGEDEQQCVFVTEDGHQVMQRTNEDGSTVLTLESAYADAVAQLVPNQVNILPDGSQIYVKQEENGQVELVQIQGTEMTEQEASEEQEAQIAENQDENSGQVVAQLIEAGEPAPGGGPRRVVLLLPDGNLMVTEVDEEQFAALELEK